MPDENAIEGVPDGFIPADEFEWDDRKNEANIRKHGIHFAEALRIFSDPAAISAKLAEL